MIAQLQINRVIEIIKDYTTFFISITCLYLSRCSKSKRYINHTLVARVEYKIHEIV